MLFVFVPWRKRDEWWMDAFPDRGLGNLPVAGRPFLEHQLDWAAGCGATHVVVLDYGYNPQLSASLTGNGRHRWPFELSYEHCDSFLDEQGTVAWCKDHGIAEIPNRSIIGPMFPYKDELIEINSIAEYADINFRVLSDPGYCTPAGYSSEPGVYLGMNVVIKTGWPIKRPLCLGDNVRIEFKCQLKGRVVVGDDSIIDAGATLENAIIFPGTYIGTKMELYRKIVVGCRVIDIDTGVWTDIEELGLCSYIEGSRTFNMIKRFFSWMFGFAGRRRKRG